jgi:membrane protein
MDPDPRPSPFGVLKRAFAMFRLHGMTDWGASMTYFLVMSLFPALLVGVSLLGLFGQQSLVTESVRYLDDAGAPQETVAGRQRRRSRA